MRGRSRIVDPIRRRLIGQQLNDIANQHSEIIALLQGHLRDHDEHITKLYHHHLDTNHRVHEAESTLSSLVGTVEVLEANMPAVLNAIASSQGTSRILRRELAELDARLHGDIESVRTDSNRQTSELYETAQRLTTHVQQDLWPLQQRVDGLESQNSTIEFLLRRVETVRAEMLHELRYGADRAATVVPTEIVNELAWKEASEHGIRFNLGCGHIPVDGYVNVDSRNLPGVDVVAAVDQLPAEPESVVEIFSSHMLEHFPGNELERQLLPYWYSLLRPGGTFRAVVPDHDAMVAAYGAGDVSFVTLREVTYGGQEYGGDFHFNAFTPESLEELLRAAGFDEIVLVERARPNGDCLEFEMSARRPS